MYRPKQIGKYLVQEIKDASIEYFRPLREHPKKIIAAGLIFASIGLYSEIQNKDQTEEQNINSFEKLELIIDKNNSAINN